MTLYITNLDNWSLFCARLATRFLSYKEIGMRCMKMQLAVTVDHINVCTCVTCLVSCVFFDKNIQSHYYTFDIFMLI